MNGTASKILFSNGRGDKDSLGKLGKPLQNMLKVWVNQKDNSLGTGELWKMKTFLFIPRDASCICVQLRVLNILYSSQAFPRHRTISHSASQLRRFTWSKPWFGSYLASDYFLWLWLWINFTKFSSWSGDVEGPFLSGKLLLRLSWIARNKSSKWWHGWA